MRVFKFLLLFFLLSNLASPLLAQPTKGFTTDNEEKFLDEIKSFFESEDKKKGREFMEPFILFWKGGQLTQQQKDDVIRICNIMLKKRLKPFPDYKNYFNALQSFSKSGQSAKSFEAWQKSLDQLINGKIQRKFADYLETSDLLFTTNTMFKSGSTEWRASNNSFTFAYDSLPKVIFTQKIDLACFAKDDTSMIYNTEGIYYPTSERWIGKGGRIKWLRAGFDEKLMYADINTHKPYKLEFKTSQYTLDSVTYYNTQYFDKPLLGKIEEKCTSGEKGSKANYPKFDSYSKRMKITELAKDIDYEGGFSMWGAKFIGSGTKEENAMVKIKVKGKVFFVGSSKSFIIRPERITADRASVVFFNEKDSIYHPGLVFQLNIKERKVTLIRDEKGIALSPYFDSFHKIDIYVEALYWKIDDPLIEMKTLLGSSQTSARFASSSYFRDFMFMKLQGLDDVNPMFRIKKFSDQNQTKSFDGDDLANFMRLSPDAVRPMLLKLSTMGVIDYDVDQNWVTIKDRLQFYLNASIKKADYDIIEFNSDIKGEANATLNLLNWDMKLNGVAQIALSDSQNVTIYPKEQELTLQKDRNFKFAGRVNAGRFEIFGKEFSFEYNNFKINLPNTDSVRLKVRSREMNEYAEYPLVRCKTIIENLNGDLIIDKPYNKSSVKNNPDYPIFNSYKPSFAYYDRRDIYRGVYTRDKFYFQLDPFQIDSLDNFDEKGLALEGTLASAGIFPQFKDKIRLQKDYSLGFIRPTPEEGFPTYGGKGTYFKEINLSNQGLRGDGIIKYVVSTTVANDIIFFPDSMNAMAQKFDIPKTLGKVEFPTVEAVDVRVHWRPYKDYMQDFTLQKPMKFYDGQAELVGYTTLEPTGLSANGRMDFAGATLASTKMVYKSMAFDADTSNFDLKSEDMGELSFSTSNVKAHIDFEKRTGEFKTNGKGSLVRFPINQYRCFMEQFKWNMDRKDIELTSTKKDKPANAQPSDPNSDIDLDGPEFVSEHPDQDSLRFFAPSAKYDSKRNIIYCSDVKYINVADSRVYPDSGRVVIQKRAKIDELKNAKILANSVTKYHNIYNADLFIYGRKNYAGNGYYDYVDEIKQKFTIFFNKIDSDTTGQTVAEGEIKDTSSFMISPQFDFEGKVKLYAANQWLTFKGGVRIEHPCDAIKRNWLNFEAEINPSEVMIPISKDAEDRENTKIASGIALTNSDSTHIYSAFLSRKENYSDQDIVGADGFLTYDKGSKEFRISNKDKLKEINFPGNYVSLNTTTCNIYGEGKVNVSNDLGQVKVKTYGNAKNNLVNNQTETDLVFALDFFFNDDAIKRIAEALDANTSADPVSYSRSVYERALREQLGKEEADKLISQLNLYGNFKKFPSELEHTFFFTDMKMKWNNETKSFVSDGKIGIGSIFKNQINKKVEGKLEIVRKRSGDILNLYIKTDDNNWYYFNYQNGLMQAFASDEKFNTIIKELKSDKRKMEVEKGQKGYSFILGTEKKKKDFLKKFETTTE